MYALMMFHCWHILIALIACLHAVSARTRKQLIRPASRRRVYRSGVLIEQGCYYNEDVLDECGSCLPSFSSSYARDFHPENAHAQTVFVGARGRGHGTPHRLDSIQQFPHGLYKLSECVRISDCPFQSDNLLESIYRLFRSHNDQHGFRDKHDSMLMKLLCRCLAESLPGIWTNRTLASNALHRAHSRRCTLLSL